MLKGKCIMIVTNNITTSQYNTRKTNNPSFKARSIPKKMEFTKAIEHDLRYYYRNVTPPVPEKQILKDTKAITNRVLKSFDNLIKHFYPYKKDEIKLTAIIEPEDNIHKLFLVTTGKKVIPYIHGGNPIVNGVSTDLENKFINVLNDSLK